MSPRELVRLARRHWIAMIVILMMTMAAGLDFRHTAPVYQSTGTVLFSASLPGQQSNPDRVSIDDLIVTADVVVASVVSPAGQLRVRQAGGTGDYQLGLVNFYNQQYPSYREPAAVLQASSRDPAVAARTFAAALKVIQQSLQVKQAAVRTKAKARISVSLTGGSSGAVPQTGYPKRTYAGLLMLAIIAAYSVATALDRHPSWRIPVRAHRRIPARN